MKHVRKEPVYMTSHERLRRCYFHQELDRPAVQTRESYPQNDPTYDPLKAYLEENTDLTRRGIDSNLLETQYPGDHIVEKAKNGCDRFVTVLHTPQGDLTAAEKTNLPGQPPMTEQYLLKSRKDAEKYLSLPMPKTGGDVTPFFIADQAMGDRGIVDVRLGSNPAGFAAELMGSELFAILSITDRDIIHALCERRMTILLNRIKFIHEKKLGPYFNMQGEEMVVPPLHGPQDFLDFNYAYDKPIIDLIHEGGGRIYIHCHGALKSVLKYFVDMGVDVLHPIEGAPTDTMTPAEAKAIIRGKTCMNGNIQIANFYERSPGEIREETAQLIRQVFDDHKGLIVAPSASPYIHGAGLQCFEQFKAMVETVTGS